MDSMQQHDVEHVFDGLEGLTHKSARGDRLPAEAESDHATKSRTGDGPRLIRPSAVFGMRWIRRGAWNHILTPPPPVPNDPRLEALKLDPRSLEADSTCSAVCWKAAGRRRVGTPRSQAPISTAERPAHLGRIIGLVADGKPPDVVAVAETLSSVQRLGCIGGLG